jgi:hypothetical protein
MRYCRSCRKLSFGKPHYCRFCRRSFNTKLCPSGHPNIRGASFCEQCGSPDLSLPQSRVAGFVVLLYVLAVFVLMLGSLLYLLFYVRELIADPNNLLKPMLMGFGLALVWLAFVTITDASR